MSSATANAPRIDANPLMKAHWTEQEQANVQLMVEFIQLLMNDHNFAAVEERFSTGSYVQHNRAIPDGISGLVGYLRGLTKRFPEYAYDVKRISADGDEVTFHSHATMKAAHRGDDTQGFNIIDTWRIVDGQIADHWDAVQPLPFSMRLFVLLTGGRDRNGNGVF